MDPDITLMYLPKDGKFISRNECCVVMSKENNRHQLPERLEDSVNKIWERRLKQNGRLFNASKFRVSSVSVNSYGLTELMLGLTDYKDFIGTNWSPQAKYFRELGEGKHGDAQAYMSDALGVGAFVVTSDDHVILQRRSENCGEAAGLWDVPGGHAEPEEILGKVDISNIDPASLPAEDVKNEVYDSILREVRDEVNIPLECLSDPQLIGIARNTTSAGRPSLEFYIRCSLSSAEVVKVYQEGTQTEAEESTNIRLIPVTEALILQHSDQDFWTTMAPSAKGCFMLYRKAVVAK